MSDMEISKELFVPTVTEEKNKTENKTDRKRDHEEMVDVQILNFEPTEDRVPVVEIESGRGWLVLLSDLDRTAKPQKIARSVLDSAHPLYAFQNDLESFSITIQKLTEKLWSRGFFYKLSDAQLADALKSILRASMFVIKG